MKHNLVKVIEMKETAHRPVRPFWLSCCLISLHFLQPFRVLSSILEFSLYRSFLVMIIIILLSVLNRFPEDVSGWGYEAWRTPERKLRSSGLNRRDCRMLWKKERNAQKHYLRLLCSAFLLSHAGGLSHISFPERRCDIATGIVGTWRVYHLPQSYVLSGFSPLRP